MSSPIKYLSSNYMRDNPSLDSEDSPWKAAQVASLLIDHGLNPASICEVGREAGGCLTVLQEKYPNRELYGFDIAPDAQHFWMHHAGLKKS